MVMRFSLISAVLKIIMGEVLHVSPEVKCFLANMDIKRIREMMLLREIGTFDSFGKKCRSMI